MLNPSGRPNAVRIRQLPWQADTLTVPNVAVWEPNGSFKFDRSQSVVSTNIEKGELPTSKTDGPDDSSAKLVNAESYRKSRFTLERSSNDSRKCTLDADGITAVNSEWGHWIMLGFGYLVMEYNHPYESIKQRMSISCNGTIEIAEDDQVVRWMDYRGDQSGSRDFVPIGHELVRPPLQDPSDELKAEEIYVNEPGDGARATLGFDGVRFDTGNSEYRSSLSVGLFGGPDVRFYHRIHKRLVWILPGKIQMLDDYDPSQSNRGVLRCLFDRDGLQFFPNGVAMEVESIKE